MTEEPEQSVEELLATSTAPLSVPFHLYGFNDEVTAKRLADLAYTFVKYIGTQLNLETLDGITISFDYGKALAELDRGYETSYVLTPSSEFAHGVAMAPAVKRYGTVKSHLVFDAGIFSRLLDENDEYMPWFIYQLAHECGHVHDRRAIDLAIPNFLLTQYDFGDELTKARYELGDGCWSEYAASRLSATFFVGQVAYYEETFVTTLEGLEQRTAAIMATFKADNEGVNCFSNLAIEYERMLRFASYLVGHIDGLDGDISLAPRFKEFLDSKHWLAGYIFELNEVFAELWGNYGNWSSPNDFNGLGTLVLLLVGRHGVEASLVQGKMFVTIH